jgi:hypothetical protein
MDLSEYERIIADEVLDPDQIEGGFDMIGGLQHEKREVGADDARVEQSLACL